MKTLIFPNIPLDMIALHDARGSGIHGGYVFYASAVQALMKHSNYERFVFFKLHKDSSFALSESPWFKAIERNIEIVHPTRIQEVTNIEDAVLVTTTERVGPLLCLRNLLIGYRPPAVGFLCAANPGWFGRFLVEMALAGVQENDALVCASQVSKTVVESMMGLLFSSERFNLDPPKCAVQTPLIPMAVDCAQFQAQRDESRQKLGFAADETIILSLGRLEMFGKGDLCPLMLAFARLQRTLRHRVRLVIAGSDGNRIAGDLKQFAAELECSGVSVCPDPRHDEKIRLLGAADIFVSLGDGVSESFGLAVVEAMASGLPCVVSEWDGYRETVVHNKTGFLVPTMWTDLGPCVDAFQNAGIDAISTLAATTAVDSEALEHYLRLLIEDPDLRKSMGKDAREHARTCFDWPVAVRQYDRLFDNLRQQRGGEYGKPASKVGQWPPASSFQVWFNSYPTRVLGPDEPIYLTAAGREWLRESGNAGIGHSDSELVDLELCVRIAQLSAGDETATLQCLTERAAESTGGPSWLVQVNIMRLLKYGMLAKTPQLN